MQWLKIPLYRLLRWSERYTKTDMVHFASGNFWLNLNRFMAIGTGMLLTVTFANLLSPEVFGTYKYVLAAAGLVAAFSLNGLMLALSRAVAQGKDNAIPAVVNQAMLWSIPASIGAFCVGVYYFLNGNNELGFAFTLIALTNSVSNGIGITKGVWQAKGEYKTATILGIPKIVIPFIVIFLTIIFTKSAIWILFAYFASNIIVSWFTYRYMLKWLKVKQSSDGVPEIVKYGKQLSLLGAFQLASGQLDQLLLWHFTTPATLAIYTLAIAPVSEIRGLLGNFLTILFPKLAVKTKEDAYKTVPLRMRQMFIASVLLAAAYIVAAPFLFTYLFPKYIDSIFISQILVLTILFQPRTIIDTLFSAHAEVGKRAKVMAVSQAIDFALTLILIPFFGLWGLIVATLLTEAGTSIVFYVMYRASARALAKDAQNKSI